MLFRVIVLLGVGALPWVLLIANSLSAVVFVGHWVSGQNGMHTLTVLFSLMLVFSESRKSHQK